MFPFVSFQIHTWRIHSIHFLPKMYLTWNKFNGNGDIMQFNAINQNYYWNFIPDYKTCAHSKYISFGLLALFSLFLICFFHVLAYVCGNKFSFKMDFVRIFSVTVIRVKYLHFFLFCLFFALICSFIRSFNSISPFGKIAI